MDINQALLSIIEEVNHKLQNLFEEEETIESELGIFGREFYRTLDEYLSDGGKRIRPFLVITAFDAVGGDHSDGDITQASLAIELLHNGSLLHDDVIDKDETRRGRPAFHVIFRNYFLEHRRNESSKARDFGEAMSIFAGDLCFPYAIESIVKSGFPEQRRLRALQSFAEGFREVIDGVIIETGDTILRTGNENTYTKMVNLKTGALIRKSVEIGGYLGGGSESQINALTAYCNHIGTAFQIQDDILGIFGEPDKLGKPVGGDIREEKNTILLIHALKKGSQKQIKTLQNLLGKEDITEKDVQTVRQIFQETGAVKNAQALINQATAEAIKVLETAEPPLEIAPKQRLIMLAKYLEERQK